MAPLNAELTAKPARQSAGQDARLDGRQDACRYGKQGEACIVLGDFHAFWCGIASWGLTSAATALTG
jgi:hypothetical protein